MFVFQKHTMILNDLKGLEFNEKTMCPCSVCKCFSFYTVKRFCMTIWVVATPPITFFIFEKQILNFWACVFIKVCVFCPKFLTVFYIFHNFLQKTSFLVLLFFQKFFKLSKFFIAIAPVDSIKMLRTSSRLRCCFELF